MNKIGSWIYFLLIGVAALLGKKPKKETKLGWEAARDIQEKAFGPGEWNVYDTSVWTLNKKSLQDFLDSNEIKNHKYEAERHDCDDFAFELKGAMSAPGWSHFAFAFAHSLVHAYDAFIDEDEEQELVEPQQARIFSVRELNIELEPYRTKGNGGRAKLGNSPYAIFSKEELKRIELCRIKRPGTWTKLGQRQQHEIAFTAVSIACEKTTNRNSLKIYLAYLHAVMCKLGAPEGTQDIYKTIKTYM